MASLDDLPANFGRARTSSYTVKTTGPTAAGNSGSTDTGSGEVSTKTVITVSVVLGVFLVASVVGAVVTFVETEAKDASRSRNQSGPIVEYIRFASKDTLAHLGAANVTLAHLGAANDTLAHFGAANDTLAQPPRRSSTVTHEPIAPQWSSTTSRSASGNSTSSLGRLLEVLAGGRMARSPV